MSIMYCITRIETLLSPNFWEPVARANATAVLAICGEIKQHLDDFRRVIVPNLDGMVADITRLDAENARLRALLAQVDVGVDDTPDQAGGDGDAGITAQSSPETTWPSSPMQRPPREGMLFSNGGPYNGPDGNATLLRELNKWTRTHGYSVKVLRRDPASRGRVKLTIVCNHAGRPREQGTRRATMATTSRVATENNQMPDPQPWSQKQHETIVGRIRTSPARDCPLRFMLLQLEPGSGTFVVQHVRRGKATSQRCDHKPDYTKSATLEPDDAIEEAEE